MKRLVLLVFALLLLAGCAGLSPDSIALSDGTAAPNVTVTVAEVVDGDTIEVRYEDGTTETVRMLGMDTPESHVENDPEEYEGVPDTEAGRACLREEASAATAYVRDTIGDREVRLVFDAVADRRGGYDRLLAYVYVDDRNLNYELVSSGYARVYDTEFTQSDRFYAAEDRAQTDESGVWRCRNPDDTAA